MALWPPAGGGRRPKLSAAGHTGPGVNRLSGGEGFDRCDAGGQPGDATAGCEAVT